MNIVIERIHKNQESIDGNLYIDGGLRICNTAEHAASALPAGCYPVIIHRCKHYRRKMPVIMLKPVNASTFELLNCSACKRMPYCGNNSTLPTYCPQIKIGNGVFKRADGSIIIGDRIVWGAIKHPVNHFNRLIDRLDKAQNRGEKIKLTIKESYKQ